MQKTTIRGLVAIGTLIAASSAVAHTSVRDTLTEGTAGYTALVIGHGCANSAGVYSSVTAQSVLFPVGNATATYTVTQGTTTSEVSAGTLSQHLVAGKLDGAISLVPDRNIFSNQTYKVNASGQVIGFTSTGGSLYTDSTGTAKFRGLVPFYVAAQTFVSTSCAKSVKIKIAVGDVCDLSKGLANTWVPSATQLGTSYTIAGYNWDGVGSPATLTINRNLTTNPLPTTGCPVSGGYDANIWPSAQDIDYYLPRDL
ncbi:MAG: hypothetical protein ACXWF8_12735 [Methylobacter sp.]